MRVAFENNRAAYIYNDITEMIQEAIDKLDGGIDDFLSENESDLIPNCIPSQGTNEKNTDDYSRHFNDSIDDYSDHESQEDAFEVVDQQSFQSGDRVTKRKFQC